MNFLDLVKERRSVRRYSPKPVSRQVIDRCLEAARLAPSACNSQPWSFIVIDDPEKVADLAPRVFGGIYSMNAFVKDAPVLVAVVTERSTYAARLGGFFKGTRYNLIDIGISCEHLVLQAAEDGVGTCWLGWFDEKALKRALGLPRGTRVDILISMGYPADDPKAEGKARKPLDQVRKYCAKDAPDEGMSG
ncbi:MAG: nitroreductase family protein [Chlamydiota bacterium]